MSSIAERETDGAAGRNATSPWRIPMPAWKDVLTRTWKEADTDHVALVAAGVSFYAFLALVPVLGAIVLTYGLLADPQTVLRNMNEMMGVMPPHIAKLVADQLLEVVHTSSDKKGLGVIVALAIALYGAHNGAGGIVIALNIAYEEEEKRGFFKVILLSFAITATGVIVAVAALLSVALFAFVEALVPAAPFFAALSKIITYLLLATMAATAAALLYRFGPSRRKAQWRWLTPGSALFAVFFVALTVGFGFYVDRFGNYNATYGSLATVVILLTYFYFSSYFLIFGAELNSELEHQTACDTTHGPEKPLGQRGAWVADHVASGTDTQAGNPDAGLQNA